LAPLARDGHQVVGLDREPAMLAGAAARVARLPAAARRRALLVRGDLGALPLHGRGRLALAAFHSVQHLETDDALAGFFAGVARCLLPGGWLAFDTFAPNAAFLARSPRARWGQTRFRHPITKQLTLYSESHHLDGAVLDMTFHYQPIDARGRTRGRARRVRLRHRLLDVAEIRQHLAAAGLSVIAAWGGFDGQPLDANTERCVFLARRASVGEPK
jgi:SAM-dependent methyltransferase